MNFALRRRTIGVKIYVWTGMKKNFLSPRFMQCILLILMNHLDFSTITFFKYRRSLNKTMINSKRCTNHEILIDENT